MKKIVLFSATLISVAGANAQTHLDTTKIHQLEDVVVKGVRAQENAPFAMADFKKSDLQNFSKSGKELPFLFANTPGILAWSENGLGIGTTYMRIRGAAGSRINVTLDGVSLNSPEDQTVFWVNMNSYGSLLGSAQILRGIGSSTNGDGAFGGTISLATATPNFEPSAEVTGSFGSYNTYHAGVNFSTGLLWNHLIFDGAYHETATDGYLHGTSGRSGSYYGGLTYIGHNFQIKYKNIGNFEKTGQAWNGVTAGNDDYSMNSYMGIKTYEDMYNLGLGKFNSLYESFTPDWKGGYTINRYQLEDGTFWDKATDNFYQNHNILSVTWNSSTHWSHSAALHYTYGHGYYKEFRSNNKFEKFGMYATSKDDNSFVKKSDFIRRKGMTQHTYGIVYNANYKDKNWDIVGGVNLQQFRANHFGYIDYIANESNLNIQKPYSGNKYYNSDAHKYDYSVFAKANYHINSMWDIFADLQYRHIDYKTNGLNDKFYKVNSNNTYKNQELNIDKKYDFFNPKAGISFHQNGHKAYFSIAYAGREPERNNFTDNGSYPAPKPEHMLDFELGYQFSGNNWNAGANLYYMNYDNQFVQTGAKSDIGENLTTNIKKSYRIGIELSADWSPVKWFTIAGNAALSQNKIKDFDEVVETYDENWVEQPSTTIHYDNSTLSFSPSTILNGFLNFHYQGISAVWHTNFVSRQYMDNSENKDRSLPSYSQTNINLKYTHHMSKHIMGMKEVVFGIDLNNIFNRHYAASGWAYSAIVDKYYSADNRYYQLGYVPMAGFNMMGNITLRF